MAEDERLQGQDQARPASSVDLSAPKVPPPPTAPQTPPPDKPHNRRPRWVLPVSIPLGVIVFLVIAAFVAAHFTSSSAFCGSCHEMKPYYASWQQSTHASPNAQCKDCHIPPGVVPYIETKLFAFREIYVHFFGSPKAPLTVTRQIPNSSCYRCHSNPPKDPTLPTVTFTHAKKHANLDCVSCHVRLVHRTVTPPTYQSPALMSSCLKCHNGTIAPNQCSYCHTPPHEPRGECSNCHNTTSFSQLGAVNHPFQLTAAHADLACNKCHVNKAGVENIAGMTLPKADPKCISCHADKHGGLTDCAKCHTPTKWANVNFKHPLDLAGAHGKLACAACHVKKPGGQTIAGTSFPAPAGATCVACHGVKHAGLTDCASCHTTSAWTPSTFNHPAAGEHSSTSFACAKCHPNGWATHSCTCHGGNPPSGG